MPKKSTFEKAKQSVMDKWEKISDDLLEIDEEICAECAFCDLYKRERSCSICPAIKLCKSTRRKALYSKIVDILEKLRDLISDGLGQLRTLEE